MLFFCIIYNLHVTILYGNDVEWTINTLELIFTHLITFLLKKYYIPGIKKHIYSFRMIIQSEFQVMERFIVKMVRYYHSSTSHTNRSIKF